MTDIPQDVIDEVAAKCDLPSWWVEINFRNLTATLSAAKTNIDDLVSALSPLNRWLALRAQMRRKGKPGWRSRRG